MVRLLKEGGTLPKQEGARRILVVEADASIGEVITDVLEAAGFAVQIAATATAALQALGGQPPEAILVDLAQPDEEGWAFLARCRQQPGCTKLPIGIMSTTLAEAAAAGMARERGYAWLPKPFQLDQLLTVVQELTRPQMREPTVSSSGPPGSSGC
jgi:DNA-binding response OmpR family regulator